MSTGDFIRTVPLFAGIDSRDLDAFLGIFRPVTFAAGECLVRQGHAADSAYILESSSAEVVTALPGGGETPVTSLGPGSVLGEMALIESATRSATVTAQEIDEFARLAAVVEPRRGEVIFEQGAPSTAWYIVVRGAVEIANAHGGRHRRVGILGPGRLCGLLALIEGQPHSMSAAAREHSALLEFDRAAFDRLYAGGDRLSSRFQDAVNQELLLALARTNNHLTRLISQARIRDARAKAAEVEELQRALGGQDCRAA